MPEETEVDDSNETKTASADGPDDEDRELWVLFEAWRVGYVTEVTPSP